MGWRVGYIAFPTIDGPQLGLELLKVQDTVGVSFCAQMADSQFLLRIRDCLVYPQLESQSKHV